MKKPISLRTVLGLSAILCLGVAMPCMAKNPSTGCGYNVTSVLYDSEARCLRSRFNTRATGLDPTRRLDPAITSLPQISRVLAVGPWAPPVPRHGESW
jgi:hypothetical protein